jgi:2',3'-cyclic-nucleotide 2'-phosphodiesterase (5'-nucleotidase family)
MNSSDQARLTIIQMNDTHAYFDIWVTTTP